MRYSSLLLSFLALTICVLAGSQTKAFAATQCGKQVMSDTTKMARTIAVDSVTTLERNGLGSLSQSRLQASEGVTAAATSTSGPRSAQSLTAEELEYWSTVDLIEK